MKKGNKMRVKLMLVKYYDEHDRCVFAHRDIYTHAYNVINNWLIEDMGIWLKRVIIEETECFYNENQKAILYPDLRWRDEEGRNIHNEVDDILLLRDVDYCIQRAKQGYRCIRIYSPHIMTEWKSSIEEAIQEYYRITKIFSS